MAYLVMKVSEILELLRKDGWLLVATRGSHRQFKHPVKPEKTGTDHGLLLKIHLPDQ
jgi:predicted RNA binding protein YcfA (HicA-like mRNA interferase family)